MKKKILVLFLMLCLFMAGCRKKKTEGIDYMALVNKEYALPEKWEEMLETVTFTNSVGDEVEVEKKAYEAYLKLKEALAKENIFVDLDFARRSIAAQQDIWDRFMETYGEVYTKTYVAVPGHSEHHTGLALDLYLIIDGKDVYLNEEMILYPEIWAKIHEKLADYGFILRYPEGKEAITGYGYEAWHIRYIDNVKIAREIMEKGITLEEYLGKLPTTDVAPPGQKEDPDTETPEIEVPENSGDTPDPQTPEEASSGNTPGPSGSDGVIELPAIP